MGRAFEYRKASKMKRWGKMSTLFPKLAKSITIAAKDGGPDPDMNATLRTAIQNAKAQNLPKDNIDRAIKRASSKDQADFAIVNYEGKGPHGVLIFVECATDNSTRTVANVRSYFTRLGDGLVPTGSLEFMFERKAVFEISKEKNPTLDAEELELELIDFGLEDIDESDETIFIFAEFTSFGDLGNALEERKIEVEKSELKRFPTSPAEYTEEQIEEIQKLLEKLEDDDDVQAVFTNMG